jgi:hypothetical protein
VSEHYPGELRRLQALQQRQQQQQQQAAAVGQPPQPLSQPQRLGAHQQSPEPLRAAGRCIRQVRVELQPHDLLVTSHLRGAARNYLGSRALQHKLYDWQASRVCVCVCVRVCVCGRGCEGLHCAACASAIPIDRLPPRCARVWPPPPTQAECLRQPAVEAGANLVYVAPTSAGKSLVADVLLLQMLAAQPGKMALMVGGW